MRENIKKKTKKYELRKGLFFYMFVQSMIQKEIKVKMRERERRKHKIEVKETNKIQDLDTVHNRHIL